MVKGSGTGFGKKTASVVLTSVSHTVHKKIDDMPDDNAAVEGAHKSEILAEKSAKIMRKVQSKRRESSERRLRYGDDTVIRGNQLNFGTPEQMRDVQEKTERTYNISHFWQRKRYKDAYKTAKKVRQLCRVHQQKVYSSKGKTKNKKGFCWRKESDDVWTDFFYSVCRNYVYISVLCDFCNRTADICDNNHMACGR